MASPKLRAAVALTLTVALALAIFVVQRGYAFTVAVPKVQLDDVPKTIGDWNAKPAELEEGTLNVLKAQDLASLRYTNSTGEVVFVHLATWTVPDQVSETCPHHPDACYGGTGWTKAETRTLELDAGPAGMVPIEVSRMMRGSEQVIIAFTYEMGDERFADDTSARLVQTRLWGKPQWPPVTKYLLQSAKPSIDEALPGITGLLVPLIQWHSQQESTPST